ncbi:MAG TPA: nucleotide exchange factor GrpE [Mariniphaga sp.]|nr:nucleotide exchange factor GrpE [Mariniphaga sp.]
MKNKAENSKTSKNKTKNQEQEENSTKIKDQVETPEVEEEVVVEETQDDNDTSSDDKINELEKKIEDLSDKHLRLQAEFDNYKKRTLREKADLIKSGGETVLSGILPVIDDFERAIVSLDKLPEDDPGKQGTVLIYSKFKEFLKQNNVKEIEALNGEFNVDYHEAITKIPAPEEKLKGKVVDVIQKGYLLNDKVIRYAKVVVGE